jgi:tRNA 5-methylaminomethyl-2-thiouridine biosynthesis bifunctional protein
LKIGDISQVNKGFQVFIMAAIRSQTYDDVYFSAHDGLAEKRHVFLHGNDLPARWANRPDFVIAEAGFGTGLTFLATLQMFLRTATTDQRLHYIAFEAHPMAVDDIRGTLERWRDEIGTEIDGLCGQYRAIVPGVHRLVFSDRVFLTLLIGDINALLPQTDLCVDAWYLDGFAPAKNPAMWSDTVFDGLKTQSATGASVATYSAARVVKEGLARSGFTVTKQSGFKYKPDMITARLATPGRAPLQSHRARKVIVHGGGLAATSVARVLKTHGHHVTLIAPHGLADGASGNRRGLYNPRLSEHLTPLATGHASGFAALYRQLHEAADDVGFAETGALHLIRSDELRTRFAGLAQNWGWGDDARIVNAADASGRAGIKLPGDALWLPRSGSVSPQRLCEYNASGIEIIRASDGIHEYDVEVLACGLAVQNWDVAKTWPLQTVRGQLSYMAANQRSSVLKTNLCYGGYLSPAFDGQHMLGSTFQHWLTDTELRDEDHRYVMDKLHEQAGPLFSDSDVRGGRAALRVTTPDRAPVIGAIDPALYVSTAHGSHGLVTSMLSALMISDRISGFPDAIPATIAKAVDPLRFPGAKTGQTNR